MPSNIVCQKMLLTFMLFLVIIWTLFVISQNSSKVGTHFLTLTGNWYLCRLYPQSPLLNLPSQLDFFLPYLPMVGAERRRTDTDCLYFFNSPSCSGPYNQPSTSHRHTKWPLLRPPTAISLSEYLSLNLGVYILGYLKSGLLLSFSWNCSF